MTEPPAAQLSLFDVAPADPSAPAGRSAPAGLSAPGRAAPPSRPAVPDAPRDPWHGRPTVLVIDGNSLVHRAFHGYARDARDDDEALAESLRGLLALIVGVCDRVGPDRVCIGFDDDRSRRAETYPAYKDGRPPKPTALRALIAAAPALLEDLGVAVWTFDGWEADDVLASAARAAEDGGHHAVLVTSDRDAFALVTDQVSVLRLRTGLGAAEVVTPASLRADLGIRPDQYLDFAALRGDTSDNLGGLIGVGPSRAAALLVELGSLEEAVADPIGCRSVLGRALGQSLLDDWVAEGSVLRRNLAVMEPRRDLAVDLDACRRRVSAEQIGACLERHGLGAMSVRVAVALAGEAEGPPLPSGPIPDDDPEEP